MKVPGGSSIILSEGDVIGFGLPTTKINHKHVFVYKLCCKKVKFSKKNDSTYQDSSFYSDEESSVATYSVAEGKRYFMRSQRGWTKSNFTVLRRSLRSQTQTKTSSSNNYIQRESLENVRGTKQLMVLLDRCISCGMCHCKGYHCDNVQVRHGVFLLKPSETHRLPKENEMQQQLREKVELSTIPFQSRQEDSLHNIFNCPPQIQIHKWTLRLAIDIEKSFLEPNYEVPLSTVIHFVEEQFNDHVQKLRKNDDISTSISHTKNGISSVQVPDPIQNQNSRPLRSDNSIVLSDGCVTNKIESATTAKNCDSSMNVTDVRSQLQDDSTSEWFEDNDDPLIAADVIRDSDGEREVNFDKVDLNTEEESVERISSNIRNLPPLVYNETSAFPKLQKNHFENDLESNEAKNSKILNANANFVSNHECENGDSGTTAIQVKPSITVRRSKNSGKMVPRSKNKCDRFKSRSQFLLESMQISSKSANAKNKVTSNCAKKKTMSEKQLLTVTSISSVLPLQHDSKLEIGPVRVLEGSTSFSASVSINNNNSPTDKRSVSVNITGKVEGDSERIAKKFRFSFGQDANTLTAARRDLDKENNGDSVGELL